MKQPKNKQFKKFNPKAEGYYTIRERVIPSECAWNLIFGERSNGKSFSVLEWCVEQYFVRGEEIAYIRRWDTDLKAHTLSTLFDVLEREGVIHTHSNGEWDSVHYYNRKFYFKRERNGKIEICDKPFMYVFSINAQEKYKSSGSWPYVRNIIFEEFLTRDVYLPNEFVDLNNLISTIARMREVRIFLLGNTMNKYCPYFVEMGLNNVKKMRQGDLDIYTFGDSKLKVCVEFTGSPAGNKKVNNYMFAFDNPKLNMITGKGDNIWEIESYPHSPCSWLPKEVAFSYFIIFDNETLQCDIIVKPDTTFTFIHRKTTEIKKPDTDLVFKQDYDMRLNYRRKISKPVDNVGRKIYSYFLKEKIFYQDNEVGEIIRNYLKWCQTAD